MFFSLLSFLRTTHPLSLSFFSLLIPPPPRSTLFPYTTLFRSHSRRRRDSNSRATSPLGSPQYSHWRQSPSSSCHRGLGRDGRRNPAVGRHAPGHLFRSAPQPLR